MKKKYLAAILGIMMATASVTACGAATTETTTRKEVVREESREMICDRKRIGH